MERGKFLVFQTKPVWELVRTASMSGRPAPVGSCSIPESEQETFWAEATAKNSKIQIKGDIAVVRLSTNFTPTALLKIILNDADGV